MCDRFCPHRGQFFTLPYFSERFRNWVEVFCSVHSPEQSFLSLNESETATNQFDDWQCISSFAKKHPNGYETVRMSMVGQSVVSATR